MDCAQLLFHSGHRHSCSQRPAGCRQLPRGGWLVVAVKGLLTGGPAVCVILPWVPAKRLWGQLHPGSRHQSCSPSRHRRRRPRCTLPLGRRSWAGLAALLGRGRLCSSEDEEAEGGQEAGRRIGTHHGNDGRMPQARLRVAGGVLRAACGFVPRGAPPAWQRLPGWSWPRRASRRQPVPGSQASSRILGPHHRFIPLPPLPPPPSVSETSPPSFVDFFACGGPRLPKQAR